MREVVLDASVLIKWYSDEPRSKKARILLERFNAGELFVVVPPLAFLELLNVAGRRWLWPDDPLLDFVDSLTALGLEIEQPALTDVARWVSAGLSASDACYAALAESRGIRLITDDEGMLASARDNAVALSSVK